MDLPSALDWLYATQLFGIKLGLEQTVRLLDAAGAMPGPGVRVVHVAGTNGKGSTSAMIEALVRSQGIKTGLFTSPHLVDFSERVRVNGEQISEDELLRLLQRVRDLAGQQEHAPTFFELALALALIHFREQGVELIILETGLGGRLDATNAVPKDIAVLTPIALDHQQYLGDTLAGVAAEKAGIIALGKPVVTVPQLSEAMEVIHRTAVERLAPMTLVGRPLSLPSLPLAGEHQQQNAALAVAVVRRLGLPLAPEKILKALSHVSWPGRFERVASGGLVLDGAHNPHAAHALAATWEREYPGHKVPVVFAASADKNIEDIVRVLDRLVCSWHCVPCSSPRVMAPTDMAGLIGTLSTAPVSRHPSLEWGLAAAQREADPVLVTGSLFLIGDVKALLADSAARSTLQ